MVGAALARATASSICWAETATPAGSASTQPFCAPPLRSNRVNRRVSMPAMPTVPSRCRYCDRVCGRTKTRRLQRRVLDDQPGGMNPGGLDVLVVGAGVADVRIGQRDELPGVAGIGEDLLVAGHRGVEHHLANARADGADRMAAKQGAVCKGKQRVGQIGQQGNLR